MASRILILLSQYPLDPTSGACRSVAGIGALLAASGFAVRALGTTATEREDGEFDVDEHLRSVGVTTVRGGAVGPTDARRVLNFNHRGVAHTLLDTGGYAPRLPLRMHPDPSFERLLDTELASFKPDCLLVFGRAPAEVDRHARARSAGAAVVLTVRNHGYYDARAFVGVDAVLMTSRYLAEQYRARIGIESTAITSPVNPTEVVAHDREPLALTFVGATMEKGVAFFARFADVLASRRPDIPVLVAPGRGTAHTLLSAAASAGIDLARHPSIMASPRVPGPADIYRPTRVLLVPSVWEEPLGRVAIEAMMNGVPPIVSRRGALPEVVGDGGVALPLPPDMIQSPASVPSAASIEPWLEAVVQLFDDESAYARLSAAARVRGRTFEPPVVNPQYVEFFSRVRLPATM